MSWALMQVMRQARECYILPQLGLCDPPGKSLGCRIAQKARRSKGDTARAFLLWNGGANPNYPWKSWRAARVTSSDRLIPSAQLPMRNWIHLAITAVALLIATTLFVEWRSEVRDRAGSKPRWPSPNNPCSARRPASRTVTAS